MSLTFLAIAIAVGVVVVTLAITAIIWTIRGIEFALKIAVVALLALAALGVAGYVVFGPGVQAALH